MPFLVHGLFGHHVSSADVLGCTFRRLNACMNSCVQRAQEKSDLL